MPYFVCPYWVTVETWRCNQADSGWRHTPSVDIKESFWGHKSTTFNFSWFYTKENIVHFPPVDPPRSYTLDLWEGEELLLYVAFHHALLHYSHCGSFNNDWLQHAVSYSKLLRTLTWLWSSAIELQQRHGADHRLTLSVPRPHGHNYENVP